MILYAPPAKIFPENNGFLENLFMEKVGSKKTASWYENINERIFTVCPVNDRYLIGSISSLSGKLSSLNDYFIWCIIFLFAGLLVSVLIALPLALWTTGSIMNILKNVSKGNISERIGKDSEDELGSVIADYNEFLSTINDLVINIKKSLDATKQISVDLAALSEETSSSMEEILATTENISSKSLLLDSEIHKTKEFSLEIEKTSDIVLNQSLEESSNINQGSASIHEMISSIDNVSETISVKMELVSGLESSALSGKKDIDEMVKIIKDITDYAGIIMDALKVINGISSTTDLLAMNAAIEAAHAGNAGMGFRVVADEIRNLAEDTAKNSKDISNSLKKLVESIFQSGNKADETNLQFDNIFGGVKNISDLMSEIRNSMNELSTTSGQIIEVLSVLIDSSVKVKDSANGMSDMTRTINGSLEQIGNISEETKQSMTELRQGMSDIQNAILSVMETGQKNLENIKSVENLVAKFYIAESDDIDK